jgi:hypothetical protein
VSITRSAGIRLFSLFYFVVRLLSFPFWPIRNPPANIVLNTNARQPAKLHFSLLIATLPSEEDVARASEAVRSAVEALRCVSILEVVANDAGHSIFMGTGLSVAMGTSHSASWGNVQLQHVVLQ